MLGLMFGDVEGSLEEGVSGEMFGTRSCELSAISL